MTGCSVNLLGAATSSVIDSRLLPLLIRREEDASLSRLGVQAPGNIPLSIDLIFSSPPKHHSVCRIRADRVPYSSCLLGRLPCLRHL